MKAIDAVVRLACLAAVAAGLPATAQEADELEPIVVTGSRIPTIPQEGPSPVTVITAEQISARGFTTILDVTNSFTQVTGTTQPESFGGFTQNASALDLRGLGPGRTLVLLDGRRVTDYPLPYNSESNFVNLSAIPAAAVERIEVLSGGASAIYGSDAVAGVINIVMKKTTDTPLDVNVRYGDTEQGGGETWRIQGVGGFSGGDFSMLYAVELYQREPVWGYQRDFQDSVQDNPVAAARINPRALLRLDPLDVDGDGFPYVDPGAAACDPFPAFEYSLRPGSGYYCGQPDDPAQSTILNERRHGSIFTRGSYAFGDHELHGSASYYRSDDTIDGNFSWFTTSELPEQYIFDVSEDPFGIGGNYTLLQRFFQPDEIGGRSQREETFDEEVITYALGVTGAINDNWRYDVTWNGSRYDLQRQQRMLLADAVYDHFIGPALGTDPLYDFYPVHAVDWNRFYAPVTPQVWQQLTDINDTSADSSNDVLSVVFNGDLFTLPDGPVASALVLEYGRQDYGITLDPELVAGNFWGRTDTGGGGERNRYAAAAEIKAPLHRKLELQLAGRYDRYDDITDVDGAFTWNAGLAYRPTRELLLRGAYADELPRAGHALRVRRHERLLHQCRRRVPLPPRRAGHVAGGLHDNLGQQPRRCARRQSGPRGRDQRLLHLRLRAGYRRPADTVGGLLRHPPQGRGARRLDRAAAGTGGRLPARPDLRRRTRRPRLGPVPGRARPHRALPGRRHDLRRVPRHDRHRPDKHRADQHQRHRCRVHGALPDRRHRRFRAAAELQRTCSSTNSRTSPATRSKNLRDDLTNFDWRSRIAASATWSRGGFSSTLFMKLYGSVPNWAETGRIGSYATFNLSAQLRRAVRRSTG